MIITDPSVIGRDEVSPALIDLLTRQRKIPRLRLLAKDWELICLRTLTMIRDDLPSFSLFSELRNGFWVFDGNTGNSHFSREAFHSEDVKFEDGLNDHLRCVQIAMTRPRVSDEHDTRTWEQLFLTQDGRLLLLASRNLKLQSNPWRRVEAVLSHLPEEKLVDFMILDSSDRGEFGGQWSWEKFFNVLLHLCRANAEKKQKTFLQAEKIKCLIQGIRDQILTP